jgi:hypothetical protein
LPASNAAGVTPGTFTPKSPGVATITCSPTNATCS